MKKSLLLVLVLGLALQLPAVDLILPLIPVL